MIFYSELWKNGRRCEVYLTSAVKGFNKLFTLPYDEWDLKIHQIFFQRHTNSKLRTTLNVFIRCLLFLLKRKLTSTFLWVF